MAYVGVGLAVAGAAAHAHATKQAAKKEGISYREMELRQQAAQHRADAAGSCFQCSKEHYLAQAAGCDEQLAQFEATRKKKAQEEEEEMDRKAHKKATNNGGGGGDDESFCSLCGEPMVKGLNFCGSCGAKIGNYDMGRASVMVTTEEHREGSKKITTTTVDEYGNRTINEEVVHAGQFLSMSVNVHNPNLNYYHQ